MDMIKSVIIGSVFFLITFYTIWDQYAKHTLEGKYLFTFLFVVWGLYAVAALMKPRPKNIGYNILDIISKRTFMDYIFLLCN